MLLALCDAYLKEPFSSVQFLQGIPGEERSSFTSVIRVDLCNVSCPSQGVIMHEERNAIIAAREQEFRSPGEQVHSWHEQTQARSEEHVGHCECSSTSSVGHCECCTAQQIFAECAIWRNAEAYNTRLFPA